MALDKQFVLRLESSTHGKLTERASEEKLSINMLLNRLVSLYLEGKIDIHDNQVTNEGIEKWEKLEEEILQIKHRLELLESRSSQEYINDKPLVQVVTKEDSSVTEEYLSPPKASEDKASSENSELSSLNEIKYVSDSDSDNSSAIDIESGESQKRSEIEEESTKESKELSSDTNNDSSSNIDSTLKGELEEDVVINSASSPSKVLEQNLPERQLEETPDEDVDQEKEVPQVVIDLFDKAGASGKVRQSKILNALGLDKKALANPPQWWSKIKFNDQKWGELLLDQD